MDNNSSLLAPLLASNDRASVLQAFELAASLGVEFLEPLVAGVSVNEDGRLAWTRQWERDVPVRSQLREDTALLAVSMQAHSPLSKLEMLDLSGLEHLSDISPLSAACSLRELSLDNCASLSDLSAISGLSKLQRLRALGCATLGELSAFSREGALTYLALSDGSDKTLDSLAGLGGLQTLVIRDWSTLQDVGAVKDMKSLRRLTFSNCPQINNLGALAGAAGLATLVVTGLQSRVDITVLGGLASLATLDLSGASDGLDLAGLRGAPQLQELDLADCGPLSSLDALLTLTQLEELTLPNLGTGAPGRHRSRKPDTLLCELATGNSSIRHHHQGRHEVARASAAAAILETLRNTERFASWAVTRPVWEAALTSHPQLFTRAVGRVVESPAGDMWWPPSCPLSRACEEFGTPPWKAEAIRFSRQHLST
jgi:Leucine-rich repeat (LRR) protein